MSYCSAVKTVKARHRYFCEWCGEPINEGERYSQYTAFSYKPYRVRLHLECIAAMDEDDTNSESEPLIAGENWRGCYCAADPCICGSSERIARARAREAQP